MVKTSLHHAHRIDIKPWWSSNPSYCLACEIDSTLVNRICLCHYHSSDWSSNGNALSLSLHCVSLICKNQLKLLYDFTHIHANSSVCQKGGHRRKMIDAFILLLLWFFLCIERFITVCSVRTKYGWWYPAIIQFYIDFSSDQIAVKIFMFWNWTWCVVKIKLIGLIHLKTLPSFRRIPCKIHSICSTFKVVFK